MMESDAPDSYQLWRHAMKCVTTVLYTTAFSLLLTGCAASRYEGNKYLPNPVAQDMATVFQQKLQSAAHWDVIAQNEAVEIASAITSSGSVGFGEMSHRSGFGKAYKKMLTARLLGNGVPVMDAGAKYILTYEVQVVKHKSRDDLPLPAGIFSLTTGAAYIIGQAVAHWTHPELLIIPFAVAGDLFLTNNRDSSSSNTEVLITTELRDKNEIVQSSTHAYYFNEADKHLYDPGKDPGKNFKVTNQG